MNDEVDTETTEAAEPSSTTIDHRRLPRGRRLHKLRDVKRMLGSVLKSIEKWDETTLAPAARVSRARVLVYGASVLGELIRGTETEDRLRQLEEIVRSRQN